MMSSFRTFVEQEYQAQATNPILQKASDAAANVVGGFANILNKKAGRLAEPFSSGPDIRDLSNSIGDKEGMRIEGVIPKNQWGRNVYLAYDMAARKEKILMTQKMEQLRQMSKGVDTPEYQKMLEIAARRDALHWDNWKTWKVIQAPSEATGGKFIVLVPYKSHYRPQHY